MKHFVLAIALFTHFCCLAQDTDEPVKIRFNISPSSVGAGYNNDREFIVKGSPFLNDTYQMGTIINGITKTKVLLRYNIYEDKFQFLNQSNIKKIVLKSANIKVKLDGITYEIVEFKESPKDNLDYYISNSSHKKKGEKSINGYFEIIHKGKTTIYLRTSKKITKLQLPQSGYETFNPSKFVLINSYFIKKEHRPAKRITLSKKKALIALNDKYNEVRAYIKNNKLKVKTEEELIQIIEYYDTLD